jgi:hypothetical protein
MIAKLERGTLPDADVGGAEVASRRVVLREVLLVERLLLVVGEYQTFSGLRNDESQIVLTLRGMTASNSVSPSILGEP